MLVERFCRVFTIGVCCVLISWRRFWCSASTRSFIVAWFVLGLVSLRFVFVCWVFVRVWVLMGFSILLFIFCFILNSVGVRG